MRFLSRKLKPTKVVGIDFILRSAELDDAEQIAALRKRVDKDKNNKNPPVDPYGGNYPRLEQQRSEIDMCIRNGIFYVALRQEQIIGCASCSQITNQSGEYGLFLVVDWEYAASDVGAALVSMIMDWAKSEHKVEKIVCRFARADKSRKSLLKTFGFEVMHEGWVYFMQAAMYNEAEMGLKMKV